MTDSSKSKSVLGKGLSALIPRIPDTAEPSVPTLLPKDSGQTHTVIEIEISKISPNPYQPRMDFDVRSMDELKRSIQENGIIQPITVRRLVSGTFELISGERRVRASQEAGLKTIPAYILKVDSSSEMLALGLVENLLRENLNPIETAISFQRLLQDCNYTQEQVAQKVGKDRTTVTNFIRLMKLPEKIQQSVREYKISMGHARALLALSDSKVQLRYHDKIISGGWSVRKIEDEIKKRERTTGGTRQSGHATPKTSGSFQSIETRLRQALGTKVVIRKNAAGGGEIVIEYYNPDDLDRLLELLEE